MQKIYIIVQSNAYDAFEQPEDNCYTDKDKAQKESDKLNKSHYGTDKKYWSYDIQELYLVI